MGFLFSSCGSNDIKEKSTEEKKSDIYYSHGTSYLLQKNYTEALSYLLKANEMTPNDTKIKNNLAMAYYFKGETNTAIKLLKESISIDDTNSDARNNLASIYFSQENYKMSQTEYELVLKDLIYKHQYRTHYNLALIQLKFNRTVEAMNHLQLSLQEKNDYCPSLYQLGMIYKNKKDYDKALEYFKEATKSTCYNLPESHFQVAELYSLLRQPELAQVKYEEVIKNFPTTSYADASKHRLGSLSKKTSEESLKDLQDDILMTPKSKKIKRSKTQYVEAPQF